jgi:CheY-like chemotaxis protein
MERRSPNNDDPEQPGWMRTESLRVSIEASSRVIESAERIIRRAQNQIHRADALLHRLRDRLQPYGIALTHRGHLPDSGSGALVSSSSGLDDMFRNAEVPTAVHGPILLIELDPDAADMYNVGLILEGFRPCLATNEQQMRDVLRTQEPLAAVADLGGSGVVWDLIDAVRMERPNRPLPLVLLTGRVDGLTVRRAAELDCAALLLMPCVPDQLASVLRKIAIPSHRTSRGFHPRRS